MIDVYQMKVHGWTLQEELWPEELSKSVQKLRLDKLKSIWYMYVSVYIDMGEFPSGQRGQTVNLLLRASMVRNHLLPPLTSVY